MIARVHRCTGIHARAGARLKSQQIIEDRQPSPLYGEGGRLGLNKQPIPVSIRGKYSRSFRYQRGSRGWRAWPW